MEPDDCKNCSELKEEISKLWIEINTLKYYISATPNLRAINNNIPKLYQPPGIGVSSDNATSASLRDNATSASPNKSYKHPDLSTVTTEIVMGLYSEHGDKVHYKLFRYIYFATGLPANDTIQIPQKMSLSPRNLNVCDNGEWHKAPTSEILVDVNRLICEIINTHLTKGEVYNKMNFIDKKIISDIVCSRFDKKILPDIMKNYISALY